MQRPRSQRLKRLGKCDQLARWFTLPQRSNWINQHEYYAWPISLVLHALRCHVRRKGFRSKTVTMVTTLLDPKHCPLMHRTRDALRQELMQEIVKA